ncbi:MAG: FAD-binding oxidoreductase [Bacteroidetes bacterium]|nr:MAG: FAD-binding oxidoreductase [Bacteroidota bacterium]
MKPVESYDYIIVGGGIFGCYAALYLAGRGARVCVIEKERALLKKASIVNQARLHGGYHYPRSVATARMSDDNKARFTRDHAPFIHSTFEKYYAIDRFGSLTDAAQFERFCAYIDIPCRRIREHPLFNFDRLEALYLTTEHTFDPILIAEWYRDRIARASGVEVRKQTRILTAEPVGDNWEICAQNMDSQEIVKMRAPAVINATYSGSNGINRLFGVEDIKLMHEISEMVFVTSPALKDIGLTVMDGQFGSLMPYGKTGLLSLSSVAYTHHKVSYDNLPHFDCQKINASCRPDFLSNCNFCDARPPSNYRKMIRQISHYFSSKVELDYFTSLFTIKSKLKANFIDDGRPTEISRLRENPQFYCIFAGKINSIYEIEKVL